MNALISFPLAPTADVASVGADLTSNLHSPSSQGKKSLRAKKIGILLLLVSASLATRAQSNTLPATGRVGIGTTQPLDQLDVRDGNILVKNLTNTVNESAIMIGHAIAFGSHTTFGTSLRTVTEDAGNNQYGLQFFTQESFMTGQSEKMRISGNGNVSIGTGPTSAKLSVAGDLQDANHGTLILGNTNHSNLRFGNHQEYSWMQSHSGKPLQISPLGNTLILNLQGGNVGIGYANPFEKLSVNGKILATEVKVAALSNWPDYVFKPGYKRMTLPEIAAFIREHGHLPEVPSAAKVEKEGLELGSMNKILLKKIEELTLELIQKDRELKIQQVRQDQQDQRLLKLEKAINMLRTNN